MSTKLREKLKDKEYRKAFVRSQIKIGVPYQIKALRERKPWTQEEFAAAAGMKQPRISAIEKVSDNLPNLDTVIRIANAHDVGLIVKFAPYSEMVDWAENFDADTFEVNDYEIETNPMALHLGLFSPCLSGTDGTGSRQSIESVSSEQLSESVIDIEKNQELIRRTRIYGGGR